jgi:hypothetical protein
MSNVPGGGDRVRPPDERYFEFRRQLLSQGDILEMPVAHGAVVWPLKPDPEESDPEESSPRRQAFFLLEPGAVREFDRLVSGPLEQRPFSMILTPTESMRAAGVPGYLHEMRTLVPVLSMDRLRELGRIEGEGDIEVARTSDEFPQYMYLPPWADIELPESMAVFDEAVTVHHDLIGDQRDRTQLTFDATQHLQRKLMRFLTGYVAPASSFTPPMW